MDSIRKASVKQLAHKIKGFGKSPRFSFFLGAGASRQSGIITAGEMIRFFKESLFNECCPDELKTETERENWLSEQEWYKKEGSQYCKLFEQYEPKEIGRQRYIESIIEGQEPSFGYVVLANLMASNYINTIITTNFDDLVYSACTSYTSIRPIVYAYGILASEMRITAQRPKILKLHGDYLYSALKNTEMEISIQDSNMARQVLQVLSEYGLIVAGYSGDDESIMKILSQISEKNDLYWCVIRGTEPNEAVKKLLSEKGGFIVEIDGFDEMMNQVREIVGFDVGKMFGSIQDRQDQMIEKLKSFAPQYSIDILSEVVDALRNQARQASEEQARIKKIQSLDFFTRGYKAAESGDHNIAEGLYRKAIELDPKDSWAHNNLGAVLYNLNRYEEAEAACRKAIKLDPKNAEAHYNLGSVLDDLKRYEEAEAAYRKAIELDPEDALAHYNLGVVLNDLNRYEEAEAAYRKAIKLDPKYATVHYNLGVVLDYLKRHEEAEAAYRKAIELDPKDTAEAYNNLGVVLRKLKRYEEAEVAYRKAIELDPKDPEIYNNLILILRFQNRNAEALTVAERSLELDDQNGNVYLSLAVIHKKLGHDTESDRYATQARELIKPDDWYNLACLESICGNKEAAIENLRRAVENPAFNRDWAMRDPDFEWIRDDPRFNEILGEKSA